jgi:hypothetical protein
MKYYKKNMRLVATTFDTIFSAFAAKSPTQIIGSSEFVVDQVSNQLTLMRFQKRRYKSFLTKQKQRH